MYRMAFLLVAIFVFCHPVSADNKSSSLVSFHLVTDRENPDSFKMELANKNEELFLTNTPQLTLSDIESATLEPINWAPDAMKMFPKQRETPPPYQILLKLTSAGQEKFSRITSQNLNRRLGIILDGKLIMAPSIKEPITSGEVVISGQFSAQESQDIVNRINNFLEESKGK